MVTQTGLKAENIASLSATAGFGPAEAKALESLRHFGFDVSKPREKKKKGVLEMLSSVGKAPERAQYELSRFVPPIKTLLLELVNNTLDKELFPYLVPAEEVVDKAGGAGKKAASLVPQAWTDGNNNNNNNGNNNNADEGRDVVVFVLGGLSYSECRAAYEVAATLGGGRQVFVGSTAIYQPQEFVRQMQHLGNAVPPPVQRLERLPHKDKVENHG